MDLQRGDLEKAGRRRRFGEEGGATALGSGGTPFQSSLSLTGCARGLGRGDGAALARREAAARSGGRLGLAIGVLYS